jgi:hypothetical protein
MFVVVFSMALKNRVFTIELPIITQGEEERESKG